MRTYWIGIARGLPSLAVLLLLVACGGGGGGGGGGTAPVVYGGNTSAAIITPTNASKLTANVVGSSDTAAIILGVSIESGDATQYRGSGAMDLALRLMRSFRETVVRAELARSAQRIVTAAIPVDVTEPCDGGNGSVRTSGALLDNGTGTLTVSFNNCLIDGVTLNGPGTVSVGAADFSVFTVSFARLTLRGPGLSIDAGGSLGVVLDLGTNTETITANQVSLNNNTGETTKTENLVIVSESMSPTSFTANITGRVFDQVHGYVDVTTANPLSFGTLSQLFPDGGQLLLTGAGNGSILASALSSTMVWLELDLDADGVREITAFLRWTELSGPVGADLSDSDGDRMHNSWETANGLDPNTAADAVLDSDGDGFSNLKEYLGGGDPNDNGVVPTLGKVALTIATGISTADSDASNPGRSGLASDGTKYLLVSCRELGSFPGIFGAFVSGATAGEPFLIASGDCRSLGGTSDNSISQPNVAFDGTNYLVVFVNGAIIRGTRVSQAGAILDGPNGFAISTGQLFSISNSFPSVAFDGANYLVVWNKFNGLDHDIYGARVTPGGQAQTEFAVSTPSGTQYAASLAFDGVNYLVVWNDGRNGNDDIYGARVTTDGTVLDPSGIPIATTPSSEDSPRLSFDGTNYLVVWRSLLSTGFDPPPAEIRGTRIGSNGALLDGLPSGGGIGINTIALGKSGPALAFDGSNFLVTWVVGAFSNSPPAGMFGAKVSAGGQIVEGAPATTGISLSNLPPAFTRFHFPVISSNGTNFLLAWVNSIELSGQMKSIAGTLIFP